MVESISRKTTGRLNSAGAKVAVALFLGLFCIVGIAAGTFLSFLPIYRALGSRSWPATTCEVLSSRVVRNDDTYRPDIRYRYYVNDRPYTGTLYNFVPGSDNFSDYPAIVDRYPAGHRFECYVDPDDPAHAVISRDLTAGYYFGLIFFLFFTGIPLGLLVIWLRAVDHLREKPPLSAAASPALGPPVGVAERRASGPIELKPKTSPLGKLVGAILICLFWNGIVGVFTYMEITGFMNDEGNWFMAAFLLIFQIVGLALIVNVPYQMLALANPRPTITLSRATVPVGGSLTVGWQLSGAAHRVRSLRLTLEAREEAQYRRGTDTRTDTHVFHRATLREVGESGGVERGTTSIRIPDETMHTFTAENNKIVWAIKMTGHIQRWPDIDESFDIMVTPAPGERDEFRDRLR